MKQVGFPIETMCLSCTIFKRELFLECRTFYFIHGIGRPVWGETIGITSRSLVSDK